MIIRQILDEANDQSDENYEDNFLEVYFNDAIAVINSTLPGIFPTMILVTDVNNEYDVVNPTLAISNTTNPPILTQRQVKAINDTFAKTLIKPLIVSLIKNKEEELDRDGYEFSRFRMNLSSFFRGFRNVINPDYCLPTDVDGNYYGSEQTENQVIGKDYAYQLSLDKEFN